VAGLHSLKIQYGSSNQTQTPFLPSFLLLLHTKVRNEPTNERRIGKTAETKPNQNYYKPAGFLVMLRGRNDICIMTGGLVNHAELRKRLRRNESGVAVATGPVVAKATHRRPTGRSQSSPRPLHHHSA
jgi:hypothetical protein